jgi:hypothetical protein
LNCSIFSLETRGLVLGLAAGGFAGTGGFVAAGGPVGVGEGAVVCADRGGDATFPVIRFPNIRAFPLYKR